MFFLARRLRRPGVLMLVYLFSYVTTQFSLFFVRDNLVVSFLGLNWGLKQAQWTSLGVFICLIPLTFLELHFSKPIRKVRWRPPMALRRNRKNHRRVIALKVKRGETSREWIG